jgi:hypothetical protein
MSPQRIAAANTEPGEVVEPAPATVTRLHQEVAARAHARLIERDRVEARAKVLQLLREQDSTADLLQLVLEAQLELIRESLVEATKDMPDARTVNVFIGKPWALDCETAATFHQASPGLLESFVAAFRVTESRDLEVL